MENKDIGLLKHCFSILGQKNKKETEEWIQKAAECLTKAGTQGIRVDYERGELYFCIQKSSGTERKFDIRYKIKPVPGGRQIILEQDVSGQKENGAYKLMCWYAVKRNENLPKGMRYLLDPVHLETRMPVKNNWEADLIRKIADMNQIILEDYKIFERLNRGEVPEEIKKRVRQEYREYEREISHGIDI